MKVNIGDHVTLKGWGLRGFTGTVVDKSALGLVVVFDPPQLRGGNNRVIVRAFNIKHVDARV